MILTTSFIFLPPSPLHLPVLSPHRHRCRRTLAERQVRLEVFIYGNEYREVGRRAIADAKAQNAMLTVYE
jgi:hypothetical protein